MNHEERDRKDWEAERDAERRRRIASTSVSGAAAFLGLPLLASMGWPGWSEVGVIQPMVAFLLATSVAAAARALDSTMLAPDRRGPVAKATGASLLLRLWLGCFAVVWITITASQVVPGIVRETEAANRAPSAVRVRAPAGTVVRFSTGARSSQVYMSLPAGAGGSAHAVVRIVR